MARDFFINGESMVAVKSNTASSIASLTNLGLSSSQVRVTPQFRHKDMPVEAWGDVPPEVQFMLAEVRITMPLIHFDRDILDECLRLSMAGSPAVGTLPRAGARMGNGVARFASGNNLISLNILSPVAAKPWRFLTAYMTGPPIDFPLGNEKSIVITNWRAIPYTTDPWNGGLGAYGTVLWDHVSD